MTEGSEVPALVKWIAGGLMLLALILVPFLLLEEQVLRAAAGPFGAGAQAGALLALLIIALFAGDVVLPIPSSLVSVAAVALFGWAGGFLIWIGMTIGCGLGYWLGSRAGRPLAERFIGRGEVARAERIAGDLGPAALVLTRAVPVLAEASTLAAGLAAMPLRRFALATGLANAGIAFVYAAWGAAAAGSSGSFLLLFAAAIAVPAVAWIALRLAVRLRIA
ncbi:MAG TPA: VTT domain-containing protein [Allosphingosinicella sp.]|nr:VTT domain-containing protein [Allosphingosinicella sp.]